MEVTTEEAQAVLLDGMEGAQYITIQRADGESLSKGVPLLTLNGELISEGMVVDMINAGVGTDYGTGTQYYEAEDLLPELEDDRTGSLAAALVVQLHQQKHQQQLHIQSQNEDPTLQDVSHLQTLTPVNSYAIQTVPEPSAVPSVYPPLQPFKRITQNVKQEFINVKSEYDVEVSTESSEDATSASGPKRTLPHKKRIPRKLKQQQTKKNAVRKDGGKSSQENAAIEPVSEAQAKPIFECELCSSKFSIQLKFFEHLKEHYEPVKQETRIAQATNTNISISVPETTHSLQNTVIEEFSDPEDIMEGIRGVVEETGAHIDDDTDCPLPSANNESAIWTITGVTEEVQQRDQQIRPPVSENKITDEKAKTDIPQTAKKKKSPKTRKSSDELTCPQCNRSFHHKNSLVYHMRSHSGERPHQCDICSKRFFAASALKVHKRLHSGDKPYKCEECGRHFRQWGDLKYHSTSIHSEQKHYQCEFCSKQFARKYSLIVHRRIHTGEKNYRCDYCNKTFRASSYLQNHRRIHTGEKPHPCVVCGKPFRVRSDMKRHMQTHSRTKTNDKQSLNRILTGKNTDEMEGDKGAQAKTIQDLVRDLKLEVKATGVVEIVPPDDNPESILPHTGAQNLEYTVTSTADTVNVDRDPLEAAVRAAPDNIPFYFM
ncbi:PREDICTED: zinc finger protein 34-like isoform X2 [Vollenhovia emeryi]|uniref:zinc finger protein 34-like isoform X2 n=1 Tax=Vollenhovia emeryi TaxID=411798 RepID=UPI0005F52156|nr:PREDICTED: zinc finger protein 34-like isoform X2 [Vollenhovia emeryi]